MLRLIISILLFLTSCVTPEAPVRTDLFKNVNLDSIDDRALESAFVENGLDGVNSSFYDITDSLRKNALKNKNSELSSDDKTKLVRLIHRTHFVSEKYDEGNMHYYGLSKLYLQIPGAFTEAVNESKLSIIDKENMLETLKNSIKNSQ